MIFVPCEQGSPEWLAARMGMPTASQYHKIITPKTMKPSSQWDGYRNHLLAEELLGYPIQDEEATDFMERGKVYEPAAIEFYELTRSVTVDRVGFCLRDDKRTGCSPDGLVGTEGIVGIKTPSAPRHVGYLLDGPDDKYRCQTQGELWITGRQWFDWLSYNPELEPALVRIERDEKFIAALAQLTDQFISYLDESRDKLIKRGIIKPQIRMVA